MLILNEVPTGVVDGVNNTFALANVPSSNGIELYQDGFRLSPTVHYTLSGATITFLAGYTPPALARLLADYEQAPISSGTDLTTLAHVKEYLNVKGSASDALLSRLITAHSTWFTNQCQRNILRSTVVETFNGDDPRVAMKTYMSPWLYGPLYGGFFEGARGFAITLTYFPILAVNSVVIDGGDGTGALTPVPPATNMGQVSQTSGWVLHEEKTKLELLGYRFTTGVNNCEISYDYGYASVPADVEQAVIDLVSIMYRSRDHIAQSSKTVGGETVSYHTGNPEWLQAVIDNYRRVKVA